ncbi:hypothetical protein REPUB_Repub05bG0154700 [Reevesia pubescens]
MASWYCNNQVRDSCFSNARYGSSCSKAQASLEKIIHLISTIPPPSENNPNPFIKKRGFDIDLNLRLGSFLNDDDESEEKSESLAENSFVGKNPDLETEEIEEKTGTVTATVTDVSSEVTEMQKGEGEVKTAAAFNDSLDLLIEAAEMISDRDYCLNEKNKEIEEVDKSVDGSSMKGNKKDSLVNVVEEGFEEIEDISPVVRSKRGRSQVLPHRFRDSVLEPWKKQRPQRSTAIAVVSKKKRKSR